MFDFFVVRREGGASFALLFWCLCLVAGIYFRFFIQINEFSSFVCKNNFLNLHRSLKRRSMKRVKLFVILALAMLLFAACSTAEYCNCG